MLLVEERLAAAKDHVAAGRRDSAGLILEGVVEINPGHAEALRMLAEVRVSQGKVDEAVRLAAAAAQRDPGNPAVLALLARLALLAGQADIAVAAVDRGLELDQRDADLSMLKATLMLAAGDYPGAERRLASALEQHPDNAGLLSALAQLYARTGTLAPALHYAQRALDAEPDNASLIARLGIQIADLGDHRNALPYLERAYLLDPADPHVVSRLANSQLGTGNLSEAQRIADRLVALHPHFLGGWHIWATVMIYRGAAGAALARFGQVAQSHGERVAALLTLAGLYRVAGRPADALHLLEPLVSRLGQIDSDNRRKATALIRDCCLSTGAFERLREIPASQTTEEADDDEPGHDLPVFIEPSLSPLEVLTLLRFPASRGTSVPVRGPASLEQVLSLVPGVAFTAGDVPKDTPEVNRIEAVPLTALFTTADSAGAPVAIPYVEATEERRAVWRRSLENLPRPLLGIAWDQTRPGLLLQDLAPVLKDFPGTLVSLVWDEGRPQLADWPDIIDAGRHFSDLSDLAALIAEVDAVVGPDGLPLHIAGAMGKTAALLTLPNFAWYWYSIEGVSFWYPSITVLQTAEPGNWAERIGDVAEAVKNFAAELVEPGEMLQ